MNTSVLSEKGWVVIPQELRKRYGLKKGDRVHMIDYGGVISIVPASEDPIRHSFGILKGKSSLTKELMKSRKHGRGSWQIARHWPARYVLDSYALLSYLQAESGGDRIVDY